MRAYGLYRESLAVLLPFIAFTKYLRTQEAGEVRRDDFKLQPMKAADLRGLVKMKYSNE